MTPFDWSSPTDDRPRQILEEFEQALSADPHLDPAQFLTGFPDAPASLLQSLEVLKLLSMAGHRASQTSGLPTGFEGQTLGGFEVIREIGRGGMGIVYEARQKDLDRLVALKILPFLVSTDSRRVNRFRNEVRLASQLQHPHIVPIYTVGQERGVHFYAMRFIEGRSLALWLNAIDDKPRSASQISAICHWIAQASEAVHHAHQEGILHRDLKPANLLVDTDGNLWVTDFGLACRPDEAGLTLTGDLVGTLRFMSPELLIEDPTPAEPRSDVYSLGVTLFELLSGKPAFQEPNQNALIRRITQGEPPRLNKCVSGLPRPLLDIVEKAMAQEKRDRYPTAKALADDLKRFRAGLPIEARPATPARRLRRWIWRHRRLATIMGMAMVFGIVTGLGLSFSWIWQAYSSEKSSRLAMETREKATLQVLQDMQVLSERVVKHSPELWDRHRDSLERMVANLCAIADEPDASRQLRMQASKGIIHVGEILAFRGDIDASQERFLTAVNRLKALDVDYPQDLEIEFQLAKAIRSKGPEKNKTDQMAAEREFARELEIRFRNLVAKDPDNTLFLNSWSETCAGQGRIFFDSGVYDQAIHWLEKADQINCKLRDMYPSAAKHPLSYIRLGNSLQLLALCYEKSGQYLQAEKTLRRAVAANSILAREQPNPLRDRDTTCTANANLGLLLASLGRFAEAEDCLVQSLADTRESSRLDPPNPGVVHARVRAVDHLTAIRRLAGRKEESSEAMEARMQCHSLPFPGPRLEAIIDSLILDPEHFTTSLEKMQALQNLLVSPMSGVEMVLGLGHLRQGDFGAAANHLEMEMRSATPWSDLATVYLALAKHVTGSKQEAGELLANLAQRFPQSQGLNAITRLALKEVNQAMNSPSKSTASNP